ncbi:TPA: hypothetical protein ACLNXZ_003643, partial [Vibrio cholerae O1]
WGIEILEGTDADLGFEVGQAARGTTSVYAQQYAYWRAQEVEHTLVDLRSGNDEFHADPEYRIPLPDGSAYRSSEYGIARGAFQEGAYVAALEISGGPGNDRLYGGVLDDVIDGGEGMDFIAGSLGDDLLRGGGGSDLIYGDAGPAPDLLEFVTRGSETGSNDSARLPASVADILATGSIGDLSLHFGDAGDWYVLSVPPAQEGWGDASGAPLSLGMIDRVEFVDDWAQTFFDGDLFVAGSSLWAGNAVLGQANLRLYAAVADGEDIVPVEEYAGAAECYLLHVLNPKSFGFVADEPAGTVPGSGVLNFQLTIDGWGTQPINVDLGVPVSSVTYGDDATIRKLNAALAATSFSHGGATTSETVFDHAFFYRTEDYRFACTLRKPGELKLTYGAGGLMSVLGFGSGQTNEAPPDALGEYDIVFDGEVGGYPEAGSGSADVTLRLDDPNYQPYLEAVGDLNHDGQADFAVGIDNETIYTANVNLAQIPSGTSYYEAVGPSRVRVQLGGTSHYITLAVPAPVVEYAAGAMTAMSAADLNADGFDDLVVGVTQICGESYTPAGVYV